jgi:amidase
MRIALTTAPPLADAEIDAVCVRAVHDAGTRLESLGHDVVEVDPPWQVPDVLKLFTASFGPAISVQIAFFALINGREPGEQDMEPLSWAIWNLSRGINSVEAMGAELQLQAISRSVITWLDDYDAVLTPALAEAPVPLGTIDSCSDDPMGAFARSGRFTPFTALFNVSGQPAISVPLYQHDNGLPLAVQLAGQPAEEGRLLALAAQLEAAAPWSERRPSIGVAAGTG